MSKKPGFYLGQILTILLQAVAGVAILLVITFLWFIGDVSSFQEYLLILSRFWFCFVTGSFLVGMIALFIQNPPRKKLIRRLIADMAVGAIPFIALIVIALVVNPASETEYRDFVFKTWQPIIAYSGLIFSLIGFYLPDWIAPRSTP